MNPLLSPKLARERAERAADVLAADPRVRLVFLFGSAADPERPSVGDIDLAVLSEPALELGELLRLRADLIDAAGPGIDLVALNEAPVVLAHEVATGGNCLFSREEGLDTDFVVRSILRYLDYKHYLDQQWQVSGERLEERQRGLAR
ncbi:MAG TPA: nucleotidyltransferase domain-containing protein [Thermoanaerobaculia bacterium]|nr:nucleotidyltransferase domain-containing protein [Thermoanaerobaculia bacterium]